jgi:hypothetical protein
MALVVPLLLTATNLERVGDQATDRHSFAGGEEADQNKPSEEVMALFVPLAATATNNPFPLLASGAHMTDCQLLLIEMSEVVHDVPFVEVMIVEPF